MNTDLQIFGQTAAAERDAWENFKSRYIVPPPTKASVKLMQSIGWQFIVILIQATAAILLASLRTAEMFYQAAAAQNFALQFIEAASAILAVEFGIVVYAAIRAEQDNRKSDDAGQLAAIKVSMGKLIVGEGIGIVVSIVAGLGVSFEGFGVQTDLKFVLALVIGAGASIIAAVSGDILGAMLARWGNLKDAADRTYAAEMSRWEEDRITSWDRSPDKAIALSGIKEARKALSRSFAGQNERTNERTLSAKGEAIIAYIDQTATDEFIPGPSQIARELGVSKSYAKTVIDIWKKKRPAPFEAPIPVELNATIE